MSAASHLLTSGRVLRSRNPLLASDGICSPANPPDMSGWNPFGEDNFSKLTEEELLDREFDLLRASKCPPPDSPSAMQPFCFF